jgi:hypothetical protein
VAADGDGAVANVTVGGELDSILAGFNLNWILSAQPL